MAPNQYGHMQLLRLAPSTGQALRRLNVIQGQVLRGKVFKFTPYGQQAGIKGVDAGGTAKIALGSHLIEAVLSQSIPEGSSVTLEVIKLADDSFSLKLVSYDPPATGNPASTNQPIITGDLIELSPEVRAPLKGQVTSENITQDAPQPQKIAVTPETASLPKAVTQNLRAAITEGFIEPAQFAADVSKIRESVSTTLTSLTDTLYQLSQTAPAQATKLAESIKTLTNIVRPLVETLPREGLEITQSTDKIAGILKVIASVLRPVSDPDAEVVLQKTQDSPSPVAATDRPVVSPAQGRTGSVTVQPDPVTGKPAEIVHGEVKQSQVVRTESSQPSIQTEPSSSRISSSEGTEVSRTDARPAGGNISSARSGAPEPVIPGSVPPGKPSEIPGQSVVPESGSTKDGIQSGGKIPVPIDPEIAAVKQATGEKSQVTSGTGKEIRVDRVIQQAETREIHIEQARNLLPGLRTLSLLADRLARSHGWTVEESAQLSSHAARLANISDAFEGVLLAPLITSSVDVPDAIPRLLLMLMFPGGIAEFGAVQRDGSSHGGISDTSVEEGESDDICFGVLRLSTENMGPLNIRIDYSETDDKPSIKGQFRVSEEITEFVRSEIPSLVRALDARGIGIASPGRIRVVARASGQADNDSIKTGETEGNGGLDLKV